MRWYSHLFFHVFFFTSIQPQKVFLSLCSMLLLLDFVCTHSRTHSSFSLCVLNMHIRIFILYERFIYIYALTRIYLSYFYIIRRIYWNSICVPCGKCIMFDNGISIPYGSYNVSARWQKKVKSVWCTSISVGDENLAPPLPPCPEKYKGWF